jgi:protein TonB
MKTKRKSGVLTCQKLLSVLSVIAVVLVISTACSQNKNKVEEAIQIAPPPPPPPPVAIPSDTVYQAVDVMPFFPGGDAALLKYIGANTTYPEAAKNKGIQGKIIVRFVVEPTGNVGRTTIIKGVDPLLDEEALRVVKKLPKFEPAIKDGKPVAVYYMVPINFTLN